MYVLYKGEDVIAIGTIEEIAEKLEVKENTIKFYGFDSYKKRIRGDNARVLVKAE